MLSYKIGRDPHRIHPHEMIKPGDIVTYRNEARRKAVGPMEVVKVVGARVQLRAAVRPGERRIKSRSARHRMEDISELDKIP